MDLALIFPWPYCSDMRQKDIVQEKKNLIPLFSY